jgi:hypothetical protein
MKAGSRPVAIYNLNAVAESSRRLRQKLVAFVTHRKNALTSHYPA